MVRVVLVATRPHAEAVFVIGVMTRRDDEPGLPQGVSMGGSDGRAAAALRQQPHVGEIQLWPRRARAAPEAFLAATEALSLAVRACAVDDGEVPSDRYAMYDQILAAAQRCGSRQHLDDPVQQLQVGKVCLAAWVAAEWARLSCARSDNRLAAILAWTIRQVWRAEGDMDLEIQGPPANVQDSCGQIAQHIRRTGNAHDPAVAGIISLVSEVYARRTHSTTAAHGILAEALVDAGRARDLTREGAERGPGTYLGEATMAALHPPQ